MNIRTLLVASIGSAALAASGAFGAISSVAGQTTLLGSNPADCTVGMLTGFTAFAWDEQQGVNIPSLTVDMVNNPGTDVTAIPGSVSGTFDSHFLHFDSAAGTPGAIGSVTFSQPIAAVIFRSLTLDATDAPLGSLGTVYPTTFPFRDIGTSGSGFSVLANVLNFNFNISPVVGVTQVRILTHSVPTPGVGVVAGLGSLALLRRRRS